MNGLSTLNRLLGKRNKDVSKSTSNLSKSTTNLDTSSQYNNKVIQLPVVANAPFEQTFRVTVLLPRDQLYVARVGAKTKLSTLLEMVCSDKLLDAPKYLFRHPADFQQGFELDMNIGEVGLNEIRLMSRKELEALRNSDYRLSTSDIFRMHQKSAREPSGGGTSVTSSDLSRTSKLALKTTSPYSSTNSLNSMDSSGVSSSSRGTPATNGHAGNGHHQMAPPVAPTRKKRIAPRPPSQNSIPEARVPQHTANGSGEKPAPEDHIFKEPQLPPYSRQNFHVSTPNLYDQELKPVDIMNNNNVAHAKASDGNRNGYPVETNNNISTNNNNNNNTHVALEEEDRKNLINTKTSYSTLKNRPTSMYIIREPDPATLQRSSENGGSMMDIHQHSRASSSCSDAKDPRDFHDMPEPTPRKRLNSSAKKSKAPAPPPRAKTTSITPVPTPSPRALTRSTLDLLRDNDAAISETDSNFSSEPDDTQRNRESRLNAVNGSVHRAPSAAHQNVSKVMLNVEQTPLNDPVVTSTTPDASERKHQKTGSTSSSVSIKIIGNASEQQQPKQASTPTAIVSKVQIGGSQPTPKTPVTPGTPGDNSSDEEIKIYNIESGKAVIKKKVAPMGEQSEQKNNVTSTNEGNDRYSQVNGRPVQNGENQPIKDRPESNGTVLPEEEQWTYRLPAPPVFADASIKSSDYDERGQFYRPASTFVDNTTLRSDMLTVVSDEMAERIEPFIQERLQTMLDLVEGGRAGETQAFYAPTPAPAGRESPMDTEETAHVSAHEATHVSSDVEDGYRVGDSRLGAATVGATESAQEAREVWLQTLEKRREKIMEGELATLSESIGGAKTVGSGMMDCRSESVNDRKGSVMNELNQLLRDGVELSRTEDKEIAVVNRSSLANFKISTYSSSENKENIITSTTSTVVEKREYHHQEEPREVVETAPMLKNGPTTEAISLPTSANHDLADSNVTVRRKISADSIVHKPNSLTQSSDEDDPAVARNASGAYQSGSAKKELAPVKRRSLTMLNKSPRVINRSDSFHSTRSDYIQSLNSPAQTVTTSTQLHLTPRSTSYISLIGAQRWENRAASGNGLSAAASFNRRMSTSELSICDSPSLQSLEVIKNILNTSRKNSLNNLHQSNIGATTEQRGGSSTEEMALPSMAAIKRNSFTDISTLAQLNGKVQMVGGMNGGNVRKDSIEEAKVEQEPEQEPEPAPASAPSPVPEPQPKAIIRVEKMKLETERVVEMRVEKIVDEPKMELPAKKAVEEEMVEELKQAAQSTVALDLTSESKSDDEKLQNKQQQKQQHSVAVPPTINAKEPQTTVVSITTNSTVVSSSNSSTTTGVTPANESDTKKWTYQGPPTISFATWNERPKIDVSIKSDRDYRFGGSSTLPRGFRNVNNVSSTKISIGPGGSSSTTTTTESSSGYVRRTIHEVDQQEQNAATNVPLTSSQERQQDPAAVVKVPATPPKPTASSGTPPGERLPIVRAVEYKKNVTPRQPPPPVEPKPSYFYETFSRNESTTSSSGSSSIVSVNGSGTAATTISRLSFGPKPQTLLQPTVRGFKSLDEATVASGMPRLRPVSMIDTSTLRKTTVALSGHPAEDTAPSSLPFSQHTLRRTGLKDKILAKDPIVNAKETTGPVQEMVTSTKLNGVSMAPVVPVPPAPVRPVSLAMAPIPPPPAPMPTMVKATQPVVRGAIVKKSPTTATSPAIDPRTALLDAIRSFNKDALKKD